VYALIPMMAFNIRKDKKFDPEINVALEFIKEDCFGIEIDLDAIPNIASSAMTLSGFSVEELRQFVYLFWTKSKCILFSYLRRRSRFR